jgi:hypothetical protein
MVFSLDRCKYWRGLSADHKMYAYVVFAQSVGDRAFEVLSVFLLEVEVFRSF